MSVADNVRPERRGVSRTRVIDEAKDKVTTLELAGHLCGGLRNVGDRRVGNCPLPGHEDKTPSFHVYADTDSWFCFGCLYGGDVVELYRIANGYSKDEVAMAAANLLHRFGYEIPPRPSGWFHKQERQKSAREKIEEVRAGVLRRRLFRVCILPLINATTGPDERRAEVERAWSEFQNIPVEGLLRRMESGDG